MQKKGSLLFKKKRGSLAFFALCILDTFFFQGHKTLEQIIGFLFFGQFLSILAIVCLVGKVSPSSDLSTATSSTNQSDFVFGNTGTFASTLIPAQVLVPYSQVPNKH